MVCVRAPSHEWAEPSPSPTCASQGQPWSVRREEAGSRKTELLVGRRLLPHSAYTRLISSKTDIVTIPALRCCRNEAHLHNAHSEILYVHCIRRKSLTRMRRRRLMGTCLKVWGQSRDPSLARRHEVIRSRSLGTGSTNGRKNLIDTRLESKLGQQSMRGLGQDAIKTSGGWSRSNQAAAGGPDVINRKAAMDSLEANPGGDQ